jgi:hypothetical protein
LTPRSLPGTRVDALVATLDVDLNAPICYACLSFVSFAIDGGDRADIARETRRVTRDMWHEGLAELALGAVRRACDQEIPDAAAALADLERNAGRSAVARAIVLRLARELLRRTRTQMRVRAVARDRLPLAPPELN